MIRLETERLILRDHVQEDIETHHELFSNNKAMKYLQDIMTHSLEESRENLNEAIEQISNSNRKLYFLRIETKENLEHVGEIGYTVEDFTPCGKHVGLGYFTREKFWNRGYTTEAARELIRYAFENNDVYRVSTGCLKENVASEHIMIKLGMIKEADRKEYTWHNGELKDRVEYRLLKSEWEASRYK